MINIDQLGSNKFAKDIPGIESASDRDRSLQPIDTAIHERRLQPEDSRSRRRQVRGPTLSERNSCAELARRYLSYGASVDPPIWSAFYQSHRIVEKEEGANDGLVSVESSKWGDYKGTLVSVSHLDLINWTNRLRWLVWEMTGNKRKQGPLPTYMIGV